MNKWDLFGMFSFDDGNEGGTPPSQEGGEVKTFKQEDVDNIVRARIDRERTTLAKSLGLESLDGLNDYLENVKGLQTSTETYKAEIETYKEQLAAKDNEVIKHKLGIKEDKFKEAVALAKIKQEGTETTLEEALIEVIKEYPSIATQTNNFGITPGNDGDADKKPKYTREFLVSMQHIPKFKAMLDEMNKK